MYICMFQSVKMTLPFLKYICIFACSSVHRNTAAMSVGTNLCSHCVTLHQLLLHVYLIFIVISRSSYWTGLWDYNTTWRREWLHAWFQVSFPILVWWWSVCELCQQRPVDHPLVCYGRRVETQQEVGPLWNLYDKDRYWSFTGLLKERPYMLMRLNQKPCFMKMRTFSWKCNIMQLICIKCVDFQENVRIFMEM